MSRRGMRSRGTTEAGGAWGLTLWMCVWHMPHVVGHAAAMLTTRRQLGVAGVPLSHIVCQGMF